MIRKVAVWARSLLLHCREYVAKVRERLTPYVLTQNVQKDGHEQKSRAIAFPASKDELCNGIEISPTSVGKRHELSHTETESLSPLLDEYYLRKPK